MSDEMLYGPTNEEMITEIFRASVKSYKQTPTESLSYSMEIPRRGAAAFRRLSRARIPDEGRLQLRRGRRGSPAFLQQDVRRVSADLRAHGSAARFPMVADTGPIGGNLSHEFIILASTGESEVFCHSDYLDFEVPDENVAFDDRASLRRSSTSGRRSMRRRPRSMTRQRSRAIPQASSSRRGASRLATSSTSARSIRSQ